VTSYSIYALGINTNQNKTISGELKTFANRSFEDLLLEIDGFYNYDFKSLISELKKQSVELSLVKQDELDEYFNSYKTEINEIQSLIEESDKDLDEMVYKLYDLTQEEIKTVEESY
jgi:hypothetical protein